MLRSSRSRATDPPGSNIILLVADIADFISFAGRYQPSFPSQPAPVLRDMSAAQFERLITFITVLVSSPLHVRNPYLLAKLVELLFGD